ncbi:hypothetical protein HLH89_32340 [Rhizobium laguerreae]|uniref:hypothetical protein n=1 Tax=Rhizobium laguerreae TaxID=1076926 RepID=UPI00147846A0|nr:hypothetical protein [Rhizobium laguerreae]NNH85649.1 hypothetical protein [Rhizobium laguerreae]
MANIDDELRVLQSALRNLVKKQRRGGDDTYRLQIKQLNEMIAARRANSSSSA